MDVRRFVEDIDALRDHLGLRTVTLLGHSWGANLGLLYAQEFPDNVARLILIGPGPLTEEMKQHYDANVYRMTDPADRQSTPFGRHGSAAGAPTGSLISTSKGSSTASIMGYSSRHSANTRTAVGCCSMSSAG